MMRSFVALGMVMGLSSAACAPAMEAEGEVDALQFETMSGKPGGQDTNGMAKIAWHTWKSTLAQAMWSPLRQSGQLSPVLVTSGMLADPGGQEVFDHAVRCAFPDSVTLTHGSRTYSGLGLVSGASAWMGEGLSPVVANNLAECVIAFVNDKTDGVDVLLTGQGVIDDEDDHSAFIYSEAIWCANVPTAFGAPVTVSVYPTSSFRRRCGIDPQSALEQRYCYQVGTCGLQYKTPLEFWDDCEEVGELGNGQYVCNGQACTMTWLLDPEPDWCDRLPE